MDMIDYNQLVANLPVAYSLHQMLYDEQGKAVDYKFLYVNKCFEEITGRLAAQVIGRTCKELFPDTEQYWIDVFENCIRNNLNTTYENYSESLKGFYQVTAYSPGPERFITMAIDVTGQKQTLKDLERSEERYRLTQEVGGVGSWEYCLKSGKYWQSKQLRRLFGIDSDDEDINDLVRSCIVDNDFFDAALKNLIENNVPLNIDFEIVRHNDGAKRVLSSKAVLVTDDNCLAVLVRGVLVDITERKLEQMMISESEANFRSITESMNDMVIISDFKGNILYVNPSFYQKMYYTTDEISGLTIFDLHPKEQLSDVEFFFKHVVDKDVFMQNNSAITYSFVDKNLRSFPVRIRVNYGTWNNEEAIFGLIEDLKEEQEANLRFDKIFRNNSAVMALTDSVNRRYVDVNNSFLTTLGYKREEIIGKTALELKVIHEDDIPLFEKAGKLMFEQGSMENFEIRVRTKSGEIRTGLFSGLFIENHGEKFGLTVMIDVSKRKYYENKLLQNAQDVAKVLRVSAEFTKQYTSSVDFDKITRVLREITGAKYLLMSILTDNLMQTTSYSSVDVSIDEISVHLGFDLRARKWKRDEAFERLWIRNKITVFDRLSDLMLSDVDADVLLKFEQMLDVERVVLVRIDGANHVVGTFVLLYGKNDEFKNSDLIEMFTVQVGQFVERKRSESELLKKMDEMERFYKLTIDRELNMIDLKREVNELLCAAEKEEKYLIVGD